MSSVCRGLPSLFAAIATLLTSCGEPRRASSSGEADAPDVRVAYRIAAGPEILVSRDPSRAHTEMRIAANPRDVDNLVATSMASPSRSRDNSVVAFASHDGGNTWTSFEPPRLQEFGGSDELLAFGPTGTAFLLPNVSPLTIPPQPGERPGYDMYRSTDGGSTWTLTKTQAASGDHPMMAVDHTRGPHRGNLYLAVEGRVFRSTDDGRTMTDTFPVMPGIVVNGGVMVLSDGSVVVAVSDRATGMHRGGIATVLSTDGGKHWSAPASVRIPSPFRLPSTRAVPPSRGLRPSDLTLGGGGESFADTAIRSAFRDRIYVAWTDAREDRARLLVSSSGDRGRTWTEPTPITPEGDSFQFMPTIATNKDGVLGMLYGDTRGLRAEDAQFNAWFVASIDGGASFLAPRRLASRPSTIETAAHGRPVINHAWPYTDSVSVYFWSILMAHPTGGDYLGLAADVAGVFHPMWADSRSGVYQAYTSRVAVLPVATRARLDSGLSDPIAVNSRVVLEVEPTAFDVATLTATIPVRLRNLSADTVFGPISVRLKAIAFRLGYPPPVPPVWKVLNADNGVSGVGASFNYTSELGDLRMLPPGGVSSPIEWRAQFEELRYGSLRLQVEITGRMRKRS